MPAFLLLAWIVITTLVFRQIGTRYKVLWVLHGVVGLVILGYFLRSLDPKIAVALLILVGTTIFTVFVAISLRRAIRTRDKRLAFRVGLMIGAWISILMSIYLVTFFIG